MDLSESISNLNDVTVTLAMHVITTEAKDSNLIFSPLSIHVILGLIAAGSKGPTQDQLLSFLGSKSTDELNSLASQLVTAVFADGSPSGGPRLSFANGVWIDQSLIFKPSFKKIVDDVYKAASNQVDFQNKPAEAADEVNSWAEKGTSGLIKEILPPGFVDDKTRLILANAIYFKGAYDGFEVLCLPYKQGEDKRRFSMYFFLPDAKDGLPALVDRIGSEPGFLDHHLPRSKVQVGDFLIPKFNISFGFEASDALKGLGLVLPFSGEGELTEMVDSPVSQDLHVSSIFHKSFIEVNEEGMEAAAATAAVMMLRSRYSGRKLDFVADHPFLFTIREDMAGVVQFVGSVVNPVVY